MKTFREIVVYSHVVGFNLHNIHDNSQIWKLGVDEIG